jgi:hypothetical protein
VRYQTYALDLGFGKPPEQAAICDGGNSLCSSRETRVDSFVVELRTLVTNVTELEQ